MKTLLIFTTIYLCGFMALSQDPTLKIYNDIDAVRTVTDKSTSQMIISSWAFNRLMANKLSYYISAENDVSLLKNYAVINVADKELSFGHNFYFVKDETFLAKKKHSTKAAYKKNPDKKTEDLGDMRSFLTVGATTTIDKGFSTLLKGSEFTNEIGLNLRYTIPFEVLVDFDTPSKQVMINKRKQYIDDDDLKGKLKKEYDTFIASLNGTSSAFKNEKEKKFLKEQDEKAKIAYADMEVENVEYNFVRLYWVSFVGNFNAPQKKYNFQRQISFTEKPYEESFRNFDFALQISKVKEYKGLFSFFTNLKLSVQNYNSILTEKNKETELNYYDIIEKDDKSTFITQVLNSDKSRKFYTGDFETFLVPKLKVQSIISPNIQKLQNKGLSIGIGAFIEQNFGDYSKTDGGLSFIFGMRGKKTDQPVNFILQVKSNNFNGQFDGNKKVLTGISVAFPFGSKIY